MTNNTVSRISKSIHFAINSLIHTKWAAGSLTHLHIKNKNEAKLLSFQRAPLLNYVPFLCSLYRLEISLSISSFLIISPLRPGVFIACWLTCFLSSSNSLCPRLLSYTRCFLPRNSREYLSLNSASSVSKDTLLIDSTFTDTFSYSCHAYKNAL